MKARTEVCNKAENNDSNSRLAKMTGSPFSQSAKWPSKPLKPYEIYLRDCLENLAENWQLK